jgi:Homeodomain-like domain
MHPPEAREEAMRLIAAGINDCEISRRMGIPRSTIRDWRQPTYVRKTQDEICPRCWRPARPIRFTPEDYSELLGLYLGDGCISPGARTQRLRLALDAKYPVIIDDAKRLLERSFPINPVGLVEAHGGTMFFVSVYCSHLSCLFPQHGPGKKHERPIVLEAWQKKLVDEAPWAFLRGCIRSDGCVFINRTDVHRPAPYEYLSYEFSNMSEDIARLFTSTCEGLGLRPRINSDRRGRWDVRINRRASVAMMREHVGLKT